jgi:hypothetical protein
VIIKEKRGEISGKNDFFYTLVGGCKPERYHSVLPFCGGSSSFILFCLSARSLLSGGACL